MEYRLIADINTAKGNINNGFVSHVENGGWVHGRIENSNGDILGEHTSSTLSWLEQDLLGKVDFNSETDSYTKNWE